jgi:hypothetical protein
MNKQIISTYFADNNAGRAEVQKSQDGYIIEYYDSAGALMQSESFVGKSIHYVEDAAENWALGIKQLNG